MSSGKVQCDVHNKRDGFSTDNLRVRGSES
jgi:hypothetical protein